MARSVAGFFGPQTWLSMNNRLASPSLIDATNSWIEGCVVDQPLILAGENVVVGIDVREPLRLPFRACLDVLPGHDREGQPVFLVRCYHHDDGLLAAFPDEPTWCGRPLSRWLDASRTSSDDLWDAQLPPERRTLWNARLFPAEKDAGGFRNWLWMLEAEAASIDQLNAWRCADRYSFEEMATRTDQVAFHERRLKIRGDEIRDSLRQYFRNDNGFSADDLAHLLGHCAEPEAWLAELIAQAHWHWNGGDSQNPEQSFAFSRILHTTASALEQQTAERNEPDAPWLGRLRSRLQPDQNQWLAQLGLTVDSPCQLSAWAAAPKAVAFEYLRRGSWAARTGRPIFQPMPCE